MKKRKVNKMCYYDVRYCQPYKLKETLNQFVYEGYEIDSYTLNKGENDVFVVVGKMDVTRDEFKKMTGIE
jgi:hypothetical protein